MSKEELIRILMLISQLEAHIVGKIRLGLSDNISAELESICSMIIDKIEEME